MKKKEYREPAVRVKMLRACHIICTSDIIEKGEPGEGGEPEPDDNGTIWPE